MEWIDGIKDANNPNNIANGTSASSSSNATHPFPELIGGVPVPYDFVPTLLIACGFFVAFLINLVKMSNKNRATIVSWASSLMVFERMLCLGMRMTAALNQNARESWGLTEYQQVSFAASYVTLLQEQLYYLHFALTLATRDGIPFDEWIVMAKKDPSLMKKREEERQWYRKRTGILDIFVGINQALAMSMFSLRWPNGDGPGTTWVRIVRLFTSLLALLLATALLASIYQIKSVEGINIRAVNRIKFTIGIIAVIPFFRACDSFRTSTTLASASNTSIPAKVAFYTCQLVPELVACLICVCSNSRKELDTGSWGDDPRKRIEAGKPAKPDHWAALRAGFRSQTWPFILRKRTRAFIRTKRWGRQEGREDGSWYIHDDEEKFGDREDRQRLLVTPTASGWQSSVDLTSTNSEFSSDYDQGGNIQKEKRSLRPPPLTLESGETARSSSILRSSLNPFKASTSGPINPPESSASSMFGGNQSDAPSASSSTSTSSRLSRFGGSVSAWFFDETSDNENSSVYGVNPNTRSARNDTLIADVSPWTPRMLQSFSFDKDSNV